MNKHPLDNAKRVKFTNKHGEKYEVIMVAGITIAIRGDETDWEYIPLFNSDFNIWSRDELYQLGKSIMELSKEY